MMKKGELYRISGPVVVAKNLDAKMYDVVRVGEEELVGEIIKISGNNYVIQVYEDTTGLKPGEPVYSTSKPLSVELGVGILKNIYDGTQRPLKEISEKTKSIFIPRGVEANALDRKKKWEFKPVVKKNSRVRRGEVLGTIKETELIEHKILSPVEGKVKEINSGKFNVEDVVAIIESFGKKYEVKLYHNWPVRNPRPFKKKFPPTIPLITGMRVIDTFFPIAKGGTAAIPGPFGSGKTVTQQSLAKWSDAQIVVYIGCGERGNEMTEVLEEFPKLEDPRSGKPLMERTVLIANTSNMPVAAREASIYTGITIAEYYRDMGYDVSLMADSTSRWAEALREIGGRLEEMPGEEGYPAYLARKIAEFYERAGRVETLGGEEGSVTVIGAVSPPGGDLSEPVTQNTLRVTKAFFALDASLAQKRHFPAINWLTSYSLYLDVLSNWFDKVGEGFSYLRKEAMKILQKEAELREIVQLVGPDALPEKEQLTLITARMLREDYLQQNAFHEIDMYCSVKKQYLMLKAILTFNTRALEALEKGVPIEKIRSSKIIEKIARMKYIEEKNLNEIEKLIGEVRKELTKLEEGE